MARSRLTRVAAAAALLLAGALVLVYLAVPQIQPCALLSRVVPAPLLPPNPSVVDPSFAPAAGARAISGEYACSGYRIEVPERWNGDLVVYAHGFRGATPRLTITDLPVRQAALAQGFAWAASSYRANGFNPEDGIEDTRLLIERFRRRVGPPKRVLIYGSSMGGYVAVASMERYPGLYAGGVSECGLIGGSGPLDYLVSVNTLADYFAGTDMFGPGHRSVATQLATLTDGVYPALGRPPDYTFDEDGLSGKVTPPPAMTLTSKGEAFRDVVINVGGGPRAFAAEGFAPAYTLMLQFPRIFLALQPRLIAAGTDVGARYAIDSGYGLADDLLNAGVRRVPADSASRARFALTGRIRAPLITIHDTGDLFVPMSNEQAYRRVVDSAGAGDLLVQRAVRRFLHCDFSLAERERAFTDLVAWEGRGVKPAGEDLRGSLRNAGLEWTVPLRPDDPSLAAAR